MRFKSFLILQSFVYRNISRFIHIILLVVKNHSAPFKKVAFRCRQEKTNTKLTSLILCLINTDINTFISLKQKALRNECFLYAILKWVALDCPSSLNFKYLVIVLTFGLYPCSNRLTLTSSNVHVVNYFLQTLGLYIRQKAYLNT